MIRPLLLLLILTVGSSVFANEEDPNTFNGIVQDDITFYHGCGTGCHSRHFQLTDPELTEEGWLRVKIMSAYYSWNPEKSSYVPGGANRGAGNKEPENTNIFWIFADCKGKKLSYGKTPDPSEMNEPRDVYYGSDMGKFSGTPQIASVNHSPYKKWAPLCLGDQTENKEMGHENKKVLLAHYKEVIEKEAKELESKAINLVIQKYDKRLKQRLEGTGKNPSYIADYEDDCNVSVRAGTHQPTTWSVMEWFDVDVCKGDAKRWRFSRKEGKVYDDDF